MDAIINNKNHPLFSVIIPSFNLGNTLSRAVDSVLNQSQSDIELIIVDDASTDQKTIDVLKELESTKITIIFLEQNGGVGHARNVGIKAARSSYILCLDSDDYIDPTYLQKAREIFDRNNDVGIVSPWYQVVGDNDGVWKYKDGFTIPDLLAENRLPSGSCVRKKVYEEVNYYNENRELSGLDDWDIWIRVFTQTKWKQVVIPEPLFFYSIRLDSQFNSMSDKKLEAALRVIAKNNIKYLQQHAEEIFIGMQITATNNRLRNKVSLRKIKQRNEWIQIKEREITNLRNSKSFRLGSLLACTVKRPHTLLSFPMHFLKIMTDKKVI